MTNLILTCAFLFLLWRLCAPGESVVAEMADMERDVSDTVNLQAVATDGPHPSAVRQWAQTLECPPFASRSLPAISPELEHAAIRMVEEWR